MNLKEIGESARQRNSKTRAIIHIEIIPIPYSPAVQEGKVLFACPLAQETVSQSSKARMYRPRVISNPSASLRASSVRNPCFDRREKSFLRSLTFVRDNNPMFSILRHSLQGEGKQYKVMQCY